MKNVPAYLAGADPNNRENPFRIEPLAPMKILHRTSVSTSYMYKAIAKIYKKICYLER